MFSGITGSVEVDGVEQPFGKWDIAYKANLVDRKSFKTRGMPRRADGQKDFTLNLEGRWDTDSTPLTIGQEYVFTCNVDDDNGVEVTARVESMTPANDMEDGPLLKVTALASDDFTPTLIQLT